jgi:hypothetical protein
VTANCAEGNCPARLSTRRRSVSQRCLLVDDLHAGTREGAARRTPTAPAEDRHSRRHIFWLREGRPEGRAQDHWLSSTLEKFSEESGQDAELMDDEEKVLAGCPDANMLALLTKNARGG